MKNHIVISTSIDLVRIAPDKIIYISSDGNYSTIMQIDGEMRTLTLQLGQVEKLLERQLGKEGKIFVRLGKSIIINRSYIYYINPSRQKLTLSDASTFSFTITASKEALKQMKEIIEKEVM